MKRLVTGATGLGLRRVLVLAVVLALTAFVVPQSSHREAPVSLVKGEGASGVDHNRNVVWILFLGSDTPLSTLGQAIATTTPRLVVVASMDSSLLESEARELRRLSRSAPLVLSGAGASEELCRALGVERLDGDVVAAAHAVARGQLTP